MPSMSAMIPITMPNGIATKAPKIVQALIKATSHRARNRIPAP